MRRENEKTKVHKFIGAKVSASAPKVSIITPAYNIAEYIAETLDSVFAQNFTGYEIVLINDGSPDTEDFEKVLNPYLDKIIYLKQENTGAAQARDAAIEHSRGTLLAFLDGDDIWLPDFLESQIEFLEKNAFDLVYADALLFGDSPLAGKTYMETSLSKGTANFEAILDLRCNVITSGTLARKQSVVAAGMFEPERVQAEDFILWLKMAQNGARIGYQRKVLLKYRSRPNNLSGDFRQQTMRAIDVYRRVRRTFRLTENQRQIIDRQLARLEAALEIENGKTFLVSEDFAAARAAFGRADAHDKSLRLRIIARLVQFAPRLLLKFYKSRRLEPPS